MVSFEVEARSLDLDLNLSVAQWYSLGNNRVVVEPQSVKPARRANLEPEGPAGPPEGARLGLWKHAKPQTQVVHALVEDNPLHHGHPFPHGVLPVRAGRVTRGTCRDKGLVGAEDSVVAVERSVLVQIKRGEP